MITLHDIDEIETGDVLGYTKTDAIRASELKAMQVVIEKSPTHMQNSMSNLLTEYEAKSTPEALFVKSIDKFEPMIQTFNDKGKLIYARNTTTEEQAKRIKENYIKPFPTMYAYYQVIHQTMIDEGFFHA